MKKNDHVQFTGKLPKELSKVKTPVYGTVVKLIGKTKAEIKPRYKRFTVEVLIMDLTKITDSAFTKKRAKKKVAKKIIAEPKVKAVNKMRPVKKEGIVKAIDKAKYPPKDNVESNPETIVKVVKAESAEEVKDILTKAEKKVAEVCDKPKPSFKTDPAEKLIPTPEPVPVPKRVVEQPVRTDRTSFPEKSIPKLEQETSNGKGTVVLTVVVIVAIVALISYFIFF